MDIPADAFPAQRVRTFYPAMHLAMIGLTVAGFGLEYAVRPPAPMAPVVAVHVAVMIAWMLLATAQSALPSLGLLSVHKKLGWLTAATGVGVILTSVVVAIYSVRHNFNPQPDQLATPQQFAIVSFRDIATFTPLFLLALLIRRRSPEAHKRLMLLATVTLMSAPLGRFNIIGPWAPAAGALLLLGAPIARDLMQRRSVHPATGFGVLAIFLSVLAIPLLAPTPLWLSFIGRITG